MLRKTLMCARATVQIFYNNGQLPEFKIIIANEKIVYSINNYFIRL